MRAPRSIQWRIALAYTFLIVISMGVVSIYLVDFVRDRFFDDLRVRLEHEAVFMSEAVAPYFQGTIDSSDLTSLVHDAGRSLNVRVTIIGRDGGALADSQEAPALMENLGDRPEVKAALLRGAQESIPLSYQVDGGLIYMGAPIQANGETVGVARLAVPTSQVQSNVNRLILTITVAAAIVVVLSVLLAVYIARRSTRSIRAVIQGAQRLEAGDLEHRVYATSSDETQELAEAFNGMASSLRQMVTDLASQRNQLSAVLTTMTDGVALLDSEGRITMVNPAAQNLLRTPLREGQRLLEAVRDHDLQRIVSDCQHSRRLQSGEVELGGGYHYISVIATPVATNETQEVLLVLHDLTKRRQVDTTRREFVSNVSHELRTPLAAVKASVESLETALDDPNVARQFLQRMNQDIDHMTRLVSDLLELSRMETGQISLGLSSTRMRDVIERAVDRHRAQAEAKSLTLSVEVPEGLPPVVADPARLQQVVSNLMDNAVKFTPEGGRIQVSAKASQGAVAVSVSDTGFGIAEEDLPHVFERLYKVDRSRQEKGTGLGLAIAKHIVQLHSGEIRVESREGEGSTFTFTVPVDTTEAG